MTDAPSQVKKLPHTIYCHGKPVKAVWIGGRWICSACGAHVRVVE